MSKESCDKKSKSFNLKLKNAERIEQIAYENKKSQSSVVDEMVEDSNGDR